MHDASDFFRRRSLMPERLPAFGFVARGSDWHWQRILPTCQLILHVVIEKEGRVATQVLDPATEEPYVLHLTGEVAGAFVGSVRADYEQALQEIAEACFVPDVFKSDQARTLIRHVRATWGDDLEFLWERLPECAIWRRKDTGKWYGILMRLDTIKLGLPQKDVRCGLADVLNLRADPAAMAALVDKHRFFPGWHMNKKTWYTTILDGTVPSEDLLQHLATSYALVGPKAGKAGKTGKADKNDKNDKARSRVRQTCQTKE